MPLNSGVFSGRLPPDQWTFFVGAAAVSAAEAVPADTAAAPTASAGAFFRNVLRFAFGIESPFLSRGGSRGPTVTLTALALALPPEPPLASAVTLRAPPLACAGRDREGRLTLFTRVRRAQRSVSTTDRAGF